MQYLVLVLLLFLCYVVPSQSNIPVSPAGGGYLEIYAPGDHVFVNDHNNFDVNLQRNGFTVEMWAYLKRPMKSPLVRAEPFDRWTLIYKAESYEFVLRATGTVFRQVGKGGTSQRGNGFDIPVNQWFYVAFMISEQYTQVVIDDRLKGEINDFPTFGNAASPLRIGRGPEPPIEGELRWNSFVDGLIDEIRISKIVRYPKEKIEEQWGWSDIIVVPEGPLEADKHTVALWHFNFDNQRGGSRFRDASGNGHHLTYHGAYLDVRPHGKLATTWGNLKIE